ncbi:hypothetical protein L227DRAFT_514472 [Lentinus tigrinus ALCF2SS1-6]|uniref:Carboxylesterase type B domain-containing protein n=1 Tax=Lentinus tigrinus ALCF2SS1-6 TaxID=1328759 RepID=A0A5C2RM38_9APHY|nr:hypothetical protein L227DRAFT_514472 [Lentinus tigrinus ALCF2SS1-6]
MNYRLHAFVFASGMEVKEAGVGNQLGLHDVQRETLRWINKHIAVFGGDTDKVTLYASRATSTNLQMVTNDGNPESLFRGVIMSSSSPAPTRDITNLQPYSIVAGPSGVFADVDSMHSSSLSVHYE